MTPSLKGILDGSLCYLIGAMDLAPDQGKNWREDIRCRSKQSGLKIKYFDPTKKVKGLKQEVKAELLLTKKLRESGNWDELSKFMKVVVRQDHRCIDISDFVIFYLDTDIHTCGSYFEFRAAMSQKKPYFLISNGGKEKVPSWLFGIMDHNFIFPDVQSVISNLVKLDSGQIPISDKWVLIRKQIKSL